MINSSVEAFRCQKRSSLKKTIVFIGKLQQATLSFILVLYVSFSFVLKTRSHCLKACDNFLGQHFFLHDTKTLKFKHYKTKTMSHVITSRWQPNVLFSASIVALAILTVGCFALQFVVTAFTKGPLLAAIHTVIEIFLPDFNYDIP